MKFRSTLALTIACATFSFAPSVWADKASVDRCRPKLDLPCAWPDGTTFVSCKADSTSGAPRVASTLRPRHQPPRLTDPYFFIISP